MTDALPTIEAVLNDPAVSTWLKNALRTALVRDVIDATHDAALLSALLGRRADQVLAGGDTEV